MKNRYRQAQDKKRRPISVHMQHRLREGIFLVTVAASIFLFISLITYQSNDPCWSNTGMGPHVANWGGHVGAWLADIVLSLFGVIAYIFPIFILLSSYSSIQASDVTPTKHKPHEWLFKSFGWMLLMMSSCALVTFYLHLSIDLPTSAGGMLGDLLSLEAASLFNKTGSTLLFATALLCGITLVTGLSWLAVLALTGEKIQIVYQQVCAQLANAYRAWRTKRMAPVKVTPKPGLLIEAEKTPSHVPMKERLPAAPVVVAPKAPVVMPRADNALEKKRHDTDLGIKLAPGTLPPVNLLNATPPAAEKAFSQISFEELSALVEQRLYDFGVEVKVVAVHPGPVITRFELELAPGIKVSKITGLAKDIARSLSTVSVRIVEVIPGKSVIGLEIPNENNELVTLRDILGTQRFIQSRSPVTLVLGKDIAGAPVVVDLTKMPHLLVAGTTGSGKSVSLNAMLLSMLFKATPEQLRLILIDPKMLELSVYDGIPHLLTPVITDMKDAANALRWCVAEMDKRYKLMASLGVRNIAGFNQKVQEAAKQDQPLLMPHSLVVDEQSAKTALQPLPTIVVIIDELADMMMVVGKKVEDLIARLAQKARAAGIHLIIATQRPSVDVITGLIKANIPTRIAFQVSSRIDSRTILDQQGAEQLLGHGDMLYLPPGAGMPIRVHGAYVADDEVHRVVAAWRSAAEPDYLYEVTDETTGSGQDGDVVNSGEQDPLYDEAVRIVIETRRASISLVQRRLRIGYNRAARMMEVMEAAGIISAMDTNGSREVLVPDTTLA